MTNERSSQSIDALTTEQASITEQSEITAPSDLPSGATTLEYVNSYLVMTEGEG